MVILNLEINPKNPYTDISKKQVISIMTCFFEFCNIIYYNWFYAYILIYQLWLISCTARLHHETHENPKLWFSWVYLFCKFLFFTISILFCKVSTIKVLYKLKLPHLMKAIGIEQILENEYIKYIRYLREELNWLHLLIGK